MQSGAKATRATALTRTLVERGEAHAALAFDGDRAVAWCEFGTPEELANIRHRKDYESRGDPLPDYWLACLFIDKEYRPGDLSRCPAGRPST
ncbi:MAG: hypothetical protein ABIQ15_06790 [Nocardioides sp.]